MRFGFLVAKCDACNALVCDEVDERDPMHLLCKGCGAKLTPFVGPGTRLDGKIWKAGMSRSKGKLASIRMAFEPQRSRDGTMARHERTLDHSANRYSEKVTLCESGEVIHVCDEPLSEHTGHGSAKGR